MCNTILKYRPLKCFTVRHFTSLVITEGKTVLPLRSMIKSINNLQIN